ncbi:unnamed protein product [Larinioides sclopetarius]|uniref:Uncharacterized protein n=1 Tax=Larinioides sclopetarius TaxID=280406 RepID=A0AAV2B0T4_9ARAC
MKKGILDISKDSSKSDSESMTQDTVDSSRKSINRTANFGKEITRRRRRKYPQRHSDDSSDDEPPKQLLRRSPNYSPQSLDKEIWRNLQNPLVSVPNITGNDLQILTEGSERSFQTSTVSNILPNFPENIQQYECESKNILPPNYKELLSSHPHFISSDKVLLSENPSESYSVVEEPMIIDTSASDPLNDLISFRNLQSSLHAIHNTDNLLQDQPNSLDNSDASSREKWNFKPSYIFRNLLHTPNNNEVEEFTCERGRIFQPNFSMDVLSEDKHIFKDLKNVFESEGKLEDSTGQTETWSLHQNVDKDVFQNLSDQDKQNCYDWDKFLERWEGMHFISGSTTVAQHHELIEEPKICLLASSRSKSRKRKKSSNISSQYVPFNGQTKKRPLITASPETLASSFKSSSSDEEHSSNQKLVLPSFENEMEIMVHTVSSNTSEANIPSSLEKFIKNTKIKLLDDDQIPPFLEKFISLDPESLPNSTNGLSFSDSFEILQEDTKNIINLFKNRVCVGENISSSTNNSEKIEELTSIGGDPSVFDDDAEMVS